MTSSQKSTEDSGSLAPYVSLGGAVVLGLGLVLRAYEWTISPSTVALMLGWCALIATGALLWKSLLAVTEESSDSTLIASQVSEGRRGDLQREKKALLRSIKDVEFDRDMGKMGGEDAGQIIRVYRARAIEIIKELDAGVNEDIDDGSIDELIERELAARLGRRAQADAAESTTSPKTAKAEKTGAGGAASIVPHGNRCGKCDAANDGDATFCKKCGAKLETSS